MISIIARGDGGPSRICFKEALGGLQIRCRRKNNGRFDKCLLDYGGIARGDRRPFRIGLKLLQVDTRLAIEEKIEEDFTSAC